MIRSLTAYLLALLLTLTSFTLAGARGSSHDIGMEVVICSGMGMTTITIGPDGQPIEQTEPCPDGSSVFAASFALPVLAGPAERLVALLPPLAGAPLVQPQELSPSARGPPALV